MNSTVDLHYGVAQECGMDDANFIAVAQLDELSEGVPKLVEVAGQSILLCLDEGRVFAVENRCSHADQPLECGRVRWGWIACPAHGARFDLETGEPLNPPASHPIRTYTVRVIDGQVKVSL
jgi:3-phenylpropionate/trans-cinnamate dioxygenase ferredoxin component